MRRAKIHSVFSVKSGGKGDLRESIFVARVLPERHRLVTLHRVQPAQQEQAGAQA